MALQNQVTGGGGQSAKRKHQYEIPEKKGPRDKSLFLKEGLDPDENSKKVIQKEDWPERETS